MNINTLIRLSEILEELELMGMDSQLSEDDLIEIADPIEKFLNKHGVNTSEQNI